MGGECMGTSVGPWTTCPCVDDLSTRTWQLTLLCSDYIGHPTHRVTISVTPHTEWLYRSPHTQSDYIGHPTHRVTISVTPHTDWLYRSPHTQSDYIGHPTHRVTISVTPHTKWLYRSPHTQSDYIGHPTHKRQKHWYEIGAGNSVIDKLLPSCIRTCSHVGQWRSQQVNEKRFSQSYLWY